MTISGTIIKGQVHLDCPTDLPDGTRVTLRSGETPYDHGKEVARILAAVARKEAGEIGRDVDDVFDDLERELNAPLMQGQQTNFA